MKTHRSTQPAHKTQVESTFEELLIFPLRRWQVQERFERLVEMDSQTGCWMWTGAKSPSGVGRYVIGDTVVRAHRLAWLLYRGESPGAVDLVPLCGNRDCVNPEHRRLGAQRRRPR